ncbi:WWOX [Symbiodinium pilosum]|uniref:WWOX protein n=1 Tax=Symbiodinium pilosum TaxID=2952 RepID=A0A812XYP0_SYMPI|nr:WWOX [Symbiodinium pilosum]
MLRLLFASLLARGLLGWPCPGNTTADDVLAGRNLTRKLAIVTGGDSGLGFATALSLAKRGAKVIIGNHNETRGRLAANNISKVTGVEVDALPLNLGSLQSVRAFAKTFYQQYGGTLNLLINDAGIGSPSVLSSDGFELVFQVDYLGHFLLTELLLPALRQGRPSRVVNVASGAHENACEGSGLPNDCFQSFAHLPPAVVANKSVTIHSRTGSYQTEASNYGVAKFLQIQHAAALANREAENGVEACSLTPGFVLTSLTEKVDIHSPFVKAVCQQQVHPTPELPANSCPFSADQGAAVIAYCATGSIRSGAYYSRSFACEEHAVTMEGFTESMQPELYTKSLAWAGEALAQFV